MLAYEAAITSFKFVSNEKKRKQNEHNLKEKNKLYNYLARKRYNTLKYCHRLQIQLRLHHCFSHTEKKDIIALGNNQADYLASDKLKDLTKNKKQAGQEKFP